MASDPDIQALNRTLKEIAHSLHKIERAANATSLAIVEIGRMLRDDREATEALVTALKPVDG